jgi:hypothetical protein
MANTSSMCQMVEQVLRNCAAAAEQTRAAEACVEDIVARLGEAGLDAFGLLDTFAAAGVRTQLYDRHRATLTLGLSAGHERLAAAATFVQGAHEALEAHGVSVALLLAAFAAADTSPSQYADATKAALQCRDGPERAFTAKALEVRATLVQLRALLDVALERKAAGHCQAGEVRRA